MVILGVTGCLLILLLNYPLCAGNGLGLPSTGRAGFDRGSARLPGESATAAPHSTREAEDTPRGWRPAREGWRGGERGEKDQIPRYRMED